MREIKEAFDRVRKDIIFLEEEKDLILNKINILEEKLSSLEVLINNKFSSIINLIDNLNDKIILPSSKESLYFNNKNLSFSFLDTNFDRQTVSPTHKSSFQTEKPLFSDTKPIFKVRNDQILRISKGNQGVQTDRQTDKKTDRQTENTFESALKSLDSLDNLKKEIRLKFKKLTTKELVVFSAIYQLEEEYGSVDYKMLSNKLNLTQSSIRDYISRLISKSIPILKSKVNNKSVQVSISPSLKKIVSLNTIMELINL